MTQKTLPADVPVDDYLTTSDSRRTAEGAELVALFESVTSAPAVLRGPTIVTFGTYAYRHASGHEGIWPRVAFSPRRAKLSLCGLQTHPDAEALLKWLGPHTAGAGRRRLRLPPRTRADPAHGATRARRSRPAGRCRRRRLIRGRWSTVELTVCVETKIPVRQINTNRQLRAPHAAN